VLKLVLVVDVDCEIVVDRLVLVVEVDCETVVERLVD